MNSTLHTSNIIVSICGNNRLNTEIIKARLSTYYCVDKNEIVQSSSKTIDTFFIPTHKNAFKLNWFYKDEAGLTASSYPILEEELLNSNNRKSIKNLLQRAKGELPELWKIKPPFVLLNHNVVNDSVNAFNDFLGMGRLYTYSKNGEHIVSTSPLAIYLVVSDDLNIDELFWDCYYTTGGGLGELTYFKNVSLVPPGCRVIYTNDKLVIKEMYSYKRLLELKKNNDLNDYDALESSLSTLKAVIPFLPEKLEIGVSGGRDSRFIAALAIKLGLKFKAYTATPPEMEAEVAERLFAAFNNGIPWEKRLTMSVSNPPTQSLLERSAKWFEYSSGDCWSSLMRRDAKFSNKNKGAPVLSGASGEIARGHDYSLEDINGDQSKRVAAVIKAKTSSRIILPLTMKINASNCLKANLLDASISGISGLYLLDYAFALNRMRRQYPMNSYGVTPILTPEIAIETFWLDPINKLEATFIKQSTNKLVPQWEQIKYMHELIEGTDAKLTNKTHTAPTFWETNRDDFFDSIKYVIDNCNSAELTMSAVEKNIAELPEGRPRTAQTYEFIFWRAGFKQTADKINRIRQKIA